ncbi:ral guanine nucleotide dissociation stimulator-like isoform X1 [Mustela erminea]|uniref:ral guanine nucleotide dissociation stimulator-like isoform X1 n=2 Tax=Mustela erminea TaxID=36723 RepID=UPI001386C063|nr:ral guanine nucleotide dissociation stimulator-like isoform X1 [Mustela erminea]
MHLAVDRNFAVGSFREGTIPVRHNGLSKVQTRSWLKPPPRCLRIFRGRRHKNAPEDMVQELNVDIPCYPSPKDKKPHRANRVWRWLRGENGSTRKRNKTSIVWNTRATSLEAAIDYLVTAVIKQDLNYVHSFLEIYRTFTTTQEVLGLLFARFGCVYSTYDEVGGPQEQCNMAVYAILDMWVERYPGDFVQPPEFPNLHAVLAYLQVNVPGSDLQRRAQLLLPERQRAETTEPEAGATAPAPEPDQDVPGEVVPAVTLAPAARLGPELAPAIPAAAGHYGLGRPVTPPDPLGPGQMVVRALVHFSATEEPPGLLTFLDDPQGPAHELPPLASVEQAGSVPELPPPASVEQAGSVPELPPPASVEQAGSVPELPPPASVEQAGSVPELPPPASVEQAGSVPELPPPASVEQAGSAPEQHPVLATTRKHVFPILLVAFFVFLLFCVYVYNYILGLIKDSRI